MDVAIVGAYIGVAGTLSASIVTAYTARRANAHQRATAQRLESAKVEAEAFQRARLIYDDAIQQLEHQIDYVTKQMDRIRNELISEQTVSDALRSRLRTMEESIHELKIPVEELKQQSGESKRTGNQIK